MSIRVYLPGPRKEYFDRYEEIYSNEEKLFILIFKDFTLYKKESKMNDFIQITRQMFNILEKDVIGNWEFKNYYFFLYVRYAFNNWMLLKKNHQQSFLFTTLLQIKVLSRVLNQTLIEHQDEIYNIKRMKILQHQFCFSHQGLARITKMRYSVY
jgi:hypothetical protein